MPGTTFEEFCTRINQDDKYAASTEVARQALEEEQENNGVLPTIIPQSEVAECVQLGHEVYVKAALVSDAEIVRYTSKSATDLGLKPWASEWHGSNTVNFYIVSLADLPSELLLSVKKVKLFQLTYVKNDKLWLTPMTQLSKGQPQDVMQHLSNKYAKKRPTGMVQSLDSLQSLADLKDLASILEAQRLERLRQDGSNQSSEALAPAGPVSQSAAMLEALEADDEGGPKKKRKATGKSVKPPSGVGSATPALALSNEAASTVAPSAVPSLTDLSSRASAKSENSKGGKSQKMAEMYEGMDDDMRKVAMLHMSLSQSSNKNASAKSLATLVVSKYIDGTVDHIKGHSMAAVIWLIKD